MESAVKPNNVISESILFGDAFDDMNFGSNDDDGFGLPSDDEESRNAKVSDLSKNAYVKPPLGSNEIKSDSTMTNVTCETPSFNDYVNIPQRMYCTNA